MRIYYFGELVTNTDQDLHNREQKTQNNQQKAPTKTISEVLHEGSEAAADAVLSFHRNNKFVIRNFSGV